MSASETRETWFEAKARELWRLHLRFRHHSSLPECFGDGYLMARNPIYRAIRREVVARGFRFTDRPFGLTRSFPFLGLRDILREKRIPFTPNTRDFPEAMRRVKASMTFGQVATAGLAQNHMFHESCHAIVDCVLPPRRSLPVRDRLCRHLIAEAYANAGEAFLFHFADSREHGAFLLANSYFSDSPGFNRPVVQLLGEEETFRLRLISFIYANFLYKELGEDELVRIWKLMRSPYPRSAKARAPILKLFRGGLSLNAGFRLVTTETFLRSESIRGDFFKLFDFDFVRHIERDRTLRRGLDSLVAIAFSERTTRGTRVRNGRREAWPGSRPAGSPPRVGASTR